MKYKDPTKFREITGPDFNIHSEYAGWEPQTYLTSLKSCNFKGKKDLLKYFGKSFFHDGAISEIKISNNSFEMNISRSTDIEDLNNFSEKRNLKINYKEINLYYNCHFATRSLIDIRIFKSRHIMDTEISFDKKLNSFLLEISLSDLGLLKFDVIKCKVRLVNFDKLKEYGINRFPYCEVCKRNMVKNV